MSDKKSKNKLVLKRHDVVTKILYPFLGFAMKRIYHVKAEPFEDIHNRPYLIVFNHQNGCDQFFVSLAMKKTIYYIASEDIFSKGFISRALSWAEGPIPIKKNATDVRAVKTCMRVAKEGGSIALAPEGNRTFSGVTVNMNPAIAKLAKAIKFPIAFFIIQGGYGMQPRWSDKVKSGYMTAGVKYVLEYEDYKDLSDDELYQIIKEKLYVDERDDTCEHYNSHNAEYLERVLYICPKCGLSEFKSKGDKVRCMKCGMTATYNKNSRFESNDAALAFTTVKEWYDYQEDYINALDTRTYNNTIIYDDRVMLSKVILYKHKEKIDNNAHLKLFYNRFEIEIDGKTRILKFDDISAVSVLGKNKINIYYGDELLQVKSKQKGFNAIKYMHFYFRYKQIVGGTNDKLLGF